VAKTFTFIKAEPLYHCRSCSTEDFFLVVEKFYYHILSELSFFFYFFIFQPWGVNDLTECLTKYFFACMIRISDCYVTSVVIFYPFPRQNELRLSFRKFTASKFCIAFCWIICTENTRDLIVTKVMIFGYYINLSEHDRKKCYAQCDSAGSGIDHNCLS